MYTFEETMILCINFTLEKQENREIQKTIGLAYKSKIIKKTDQIFYFTNKKYPLISLHQD
jgi:hypothetical protein